MTAARVAEVERLHATIDDLMHRIRRLTGGAELEYLRRFEVRVYALAGEDITDTNVTRDDVLRTLAERLGRTT